MEESFALLSTMSPRIKKASKTTEDRIIKEYEKEAPSRLALKKPFRHTRRKDPELKRILVKYLPEAIVSSESEDSNSGDLNLTQDEIYNCTVVILESDSESDTGPHREVLKCDKDAKATKDEFGGINSTLFSNISAISGDNENNNPLLNRNNLAINSTFVEGTKKNHKRFDQFFKTPARNKQNFSEHQQTVIIIDDSDEEHITQSPNINSDCVESCGSNEEVLPEDLKASYEKILNDVYGNTWKCKEAEIFKDLSNSVGKTRNKDKDLTYSEKKPNLRRLNELKGEAQSERKKKIDTTEGNTNLNQKKVYTERKPTRKEKENHVPPGTPTHYEDILDKIYGKSWRENREKLFDKPSVDDEVQETGGSRNRVANHSSDSEEDEIKFIKRRTKTKKKFVLPSDDSDSDTNSDNIRKPDVHAWRTPEPSKKTYYNLPLRAATAVPAKKKLSFLASLSGSAPVEKCDLAARKYRDSYKTCKEELARTLFKMFNEHVFDNRLSQDMELEWNKRMTRTAGVCYCKKITRRTGLTLRSARIVLASKILDSADRLRDTLVHEMCHAATWIVDEVADGHGAKWQRWAAAAMTKYPELPPIKRCHDYAIITKYTYKCTKCGYAIGRHSKSIDIERKRCGMCYGKFEVLLNKMTKNGRQAVATPASGGKNLNGFAAFVQQRYAEIKRPDLQHKDVMRILSEKFAEMKTQ